MWRLSPLDRLKWLKEKECKLCGARSRTISEKIGVCVDCLRDRPEEALEIAMKIHEDSKGAFGLPPCPPRSESGVRCGMCGNECVIPEGGLGYCGLVRNVGGKLEWRVRLPREAIVDWYYDPLPTNCVAEWFCPGTTGIGYPKYAVCRGGEHGYYNLAVFYGACNLDCVFCQNWTYRRNTEKLSPIRTVDELVRAVGPKVTCICYFGGDPSPQLTHAIAASIKALERARKEGRILRICWETNGNMNENLLKQVVKLSLESGGIVKFDMKAWTPSVYRALTGVDNARVFENAKFVAKFIEERPEVPLFTVSTLLVPGYVDEHEVRMIARFLADLDPSIPYSLLAFHPDYLLTDLPPTSKRHAEECVKAAREEGLENVSIGNYWLLGDYY